MDALQSLVEDITQLCQTYPNEKAGLLQLSRIIRLI